jgi:hypothetical protein
LRKLQSNGTVQPMSDSDTECYTVTGKSTIHKVDAQGNPDFNGTEFHIVEERTEGYEVYVHQRDPSQPAGRYFILKKYFV